MSCLNIGTSFNPWFAPSLDIRRSQLPPEKTEQILSWWSLLENLMCYFASCCCDQTLMKSRLGGKCLFGLYFQVIVRYRGKSGQELKQEPGSRNGCSGVRRMLLTSVLIWLGQFASYTNTEPSSIQRWARSSNINTFFLMTVRTVFSLYFGNLAILVLYAHVPFLVLDSSIKKNPGSFQRQGDRNDTQVLYHHTQDKAIPDLHHRSN